MGGELRLRRMRVTNLYQTACILWGGPTVTTHKITYGRLRGHKVVLAHRVVYENKYGAIPAGLTIDHLCRNGLCVNSNHLEAVTNKVNILRGYGAPAVNARKTHCNRGHKLTKENIYSFRLLRYGKRECKLCGRERQKRLKTSGWIRPALRVQ